MFAALSAITGILYSNYKSDERNQKGLENSNKQLIEEMTRDKKEIATFELLRKILAILNENLKKDRIPWIATGELVKEMFEDHEKDRTFLLEYNSFVQNELYYYFIDLINNPHLFNYLHPDVQNEINTFTKKYYRIQQKFELYINEQFNGNLREKTETFKYTIINNNPHPNNHLKMGNYLNKTIDNYRFDPKFKDLPVKPEGKATVLVKINEYDYNDLEYLANKITYLAYIVSLNYGYEII